MYLDREDMRNIAKGIAKRFAKDPGKWRKIIRKIDPHIGCGLSLYGSESDPPTPEEAAHALNYMHMAVNGVRPFPDDMSVGGGVAGEKGETGVTRQCCQMCLKLPEFGCGAEGFTCQAQVRFTCGLFSCDPDMHNHHSCLSEFVCAVLFRCSTFIGEDGDCLTFECDEPRPYESCPDTPYSW